MLNNHLKQVIWKFQGPAFMLILCPVVIYCILIRIELLSCKLSSERGKGVCRVNFHGEVTLRIP